MKSYIFILLSIFFVPCICYAQSNYKPGYFINTKGDTTRGYIDYHEWSNNPKEINFKSTPQDKPHKINFEGMDCFAVNDVVTYKKYTLRVSMNSINTNSFSSISTNRDTSSKPITALLQILTTGNNLTLYSYTDEIKTRFFIGEAPEFSPTELIYRIYVNDGSYSSSNGLTVNENIYMNQLFALAAKYNKASDRLKRDIEDATYNSAALTEVTEKINDDAASRTKHNMPYKEVVYFAGIAANIATTASNAGTPYHESGGKDHTSILPKLTLGVNAFGNPVTRRLVFAGELGFTGNAYNVTYADLKNPYGTYRYKFNQYAVSVSPQIIYNLYNTEKFRFFAGVGVAINYYSYTNKSFDRVEGGNTLLANPFNFTDFSLNYLAKAGVLLYNKVEIYSNYIFDDNLTTSSDNYFFLHAHALQIGVNYHF